MTVPDRDWVGRELGEAARAALARGLAASELWSLLLDVVEQRARERDPAAVRRQWERDRFVKPSPIDQRTFHELDGHLLAVAHPFEALELSPLAPLGACSAVGPTSQNKIVSTVRGTEVVSDPTNVLALESERRLREDPRAVVRLAASQRCVRAQPVPTGPGFAAHFRIFCLSTAGRETREHRFLTEALVEQVRTHLAILDRLERHGYAFPRRRVRILASPKRQALGQRIAEALVDVAPRSELLENGYYDGLRFTIGADLPGSDESRGGNEIPLIDGGTFDWLHRLASNQRLVFVASAIGSQLAAHLYRRT